jgi:hypothetical protein
MLTIISMKRRVPTAFFVLSQIVPKSMVEVLEAWFDNGLEEIIVEVVHELEVVSLLQHFPVFVHLIEIRVLDGRQALREWESKRRKSTDGRL